MAAEFPEFPHSSPEAPASAEEDGVTADTKYTKPEVNYRDAGSSGTRCERCTNFRWSGGQRGMGTCRIVAGPIESGAVCDAYEGGGGGLMDLVTGEETY